MGIAPIVIVLNDEVGPPPVQSPITLNDDDEDFVTHWPVSSYLAYCRDTYRSVYVELVLDGGGDSGNNTPDMPFLRNVFRTGMSPLLGEVMASPGARQSNGSRDPHYWVAYVLCAWQQAYNRDLDPNTQMGWSWGSTSMLLGGSAIWAETCRDLAVLNMYTANAEYNDFAHTACHEMGHQFGIDEEDETNSSIMGADFAAPNANRFLPRHAKMIREQQAVENKPIATP